MKEITIVVPVYNASSYVERCIKSILKQTYKNIEVLIVNDGSTDDSLHLCQRMQSLDNRIRIIDKKTNEGVEKARYDGLKEVKTKWVSFVDADDWLKLDAIQKLYEITSKETVDVVCAESKSVLSAFLPDILPSHSYVGKFLQYKNKKLEGKALKDLYVSFFGKNILPVTMNAKLYRTDILLDLPYEKTNLRFGEDLIFNMNLFPHLNSIYWLDDVVYYYRIGSGGTSKFMPYFMDNVRKLYVMKMLALKKYGSINYAHFVKIELINCLQANIRQYLRFYPKRKIENINAISKELELPVYGDLACLGYKKTNILDFIINKNAEALYNIVEKEYKNRSLRQKARDYGTSLLKKLM